MELHKNSKYELVIVLEPGEKYECYGVRNLQTSVIEAYIGQLARAIQIADNFERDLLYPVKEPNGDEFMKALEDVFGNSATPKKKAPKGRLDG